MAEHYVKDKRELKTIYLVLKSFLLFFGVMQVR